MIYIGSVCILQILLSNRAISLSRHGGRSSIQFLIHWRRVQNREKGSELVWTRLWLCREINFFMINLRKSSWKLTLARFVKPAICGAGSVGLISQATQADSEMKTKPLWASGIVNVLPSDGVDIRTGIYAAKHIPRISYWQPLSTKHTVRSTLTILIRTTILYS